MSPLKLILLMGFLSSISSSSSSSSSTSLSLEDDLWREEENWWRDNRKERWKREETKEIEENERVNDNFRCKRTNISIANGQRCDGEEDCPEGDDEEKCDTYKCPDNMFKCDNGVCLSLDKSCNRKKECKDGSDERKCNYKNCLDFKEFECGNGECIKPIGICNGSEECSDGSDEKQCDDSDFLQCKSGKKVHKFYWCDGISHCTPMEDLNPIADHTDENNCTEQCNLPDIFHCKSGECISIGKKCDGFCHCEDCDDEDFDCTHTYTRHSGVIKCKENVSVDCPLGAEHPKDASCIRKEHICDGIIQCRSPQNYSEENGCNDEECREGDYRCEGEHGQCVGSMYLCDGIRHCLHGDDENIDKLCGYHHACKEGEWLCDNFKKCINKTQVCDSEFDCSDRSDEMNCEDHECTADQKKCKSGQCIRKEYWCDHFKDCLDSSDETDCESEYQEKCEGDDVFKCATGNQCIPIKDHCILKSRQGCVDDSHLLNCTLKECPEGMRKCQSGPCGPIGNCNDVLLCPESWDDIEQCEYQCSSKASNCSCLQNSADCSNLQLYTFPDLHFSAQIKKLNMSNNNLSNYLSGGMIKTAGATVLSSLNLSSNGITKLGNEIFTYMAGLNILDLRNNNITTISRKNFKGLRNVSMLSLQGNQISTLESMAFHDIESLSLLDLSNQKLRDIDINAFSGLNVTILDLNGNPDLDRDDLDERIFQKFQYLKYVATDSVNVCCRVESSGHACLPEMDDFSSCRDLIDNVGLRASLWIMGIWAIIGNLIVILYHFIASFNNKIYPFLLINLGIGDLLMGFYLIIIASADVHYRGVYAINVRNWKTSTVCNLAGFLSTVSSELSVFTLTVISIERLMILASPYHSLKRDITKTKRNYRFVMLGAWLIAGFLAGLPLMGINYFKDFYSRSGVCLALHITEDKPAGWMYSVFVFIVLNFVSFFVIAVSQALIYLAIRKNKMKSGQRFPGGQSTSKHTYSSVNRQNKRGSQQNTDERKSVQTTQNSPIENAGESSEDEGSRLNENIDRGNGQNNQNSANRNEQNDNNSDRSGQNTNSKKSNKSRNGQNTDNKKNSKRQNDSQNSSAIQQAGPKNNKRGISTQNGAPRRDGTKYKKRTEIILTLIVFTDALCWLPIIFLGFGNICGWPSSPKVFTWIAIFVLPINSALNPIIYTFIDQKLRQKVRGIRKSISSRSTSLTEVASRLSSTFRNRKSSENGEPAKIKYKDTVCVYTPNRNPTVTHHTIEVQQHA